MNQHAGRKVRLLLEAVAPGMDEARRDKLRFAILTLLDDAAFVCTFPGCGRVYRWVPGVLSSPGGLIPNHCGGHGGEGAP